MSALGWLYGPLSGGLAAATGSFLSAQTAYTLSRHVGRPMAVRLAGEENLQAAGEWFTRRGGAVIALSRCLPVFNEAVACLAGLSKYPPRDFATAALLGSVPVGFLFAFIGHLGREDSTTATLLSVLIPILLWMLHRKISRSTGSRKTPPAAPRNR